MHGREEGGWVGGWVGVVWILRTAVGKYEGTVMKDQENVGHTM